MKFIAVLQIQIHAKQESGLSGNVHCKIHMLRMRIEVHHKERECRADSLKCGNCNFALYAVGSQVPNVS